MSLVAVLSVPAIEKYWGIKPTTFARNHPYRVYIGVCFYILVVAVVFLTASLNRYGAEFDGNVGAALFRYFGGYEHPEHGYFFGGRVDMPHYFNIARYGYINVDNDLRLNIVFYPLYSCLLFVLNFIFRNFAVTGIVLNIFLTFLSAKLLYGLVRDRVGHAEGARAVKYLLLFPMAYYLITPMSEALFLFLSVATFHCLIKKRYALLFLCAFATGLTRSVGLMIFAPIIIEAGRQYFRGKDVKSAVKLLICAAAPFVAFGVYLLINYFIYGNFFQFLDFQKNHWHQQISYFWNTANYLTSHALSWYRSGSLGSFFGIAVSGLGAMALVLGLTAYGAKRIPPVYTAYAAAYFTMAFGATWMLSGARYTVCIFPIAVSMARLTRNKWFDKIFTAAYGFSAVVYLFFFVGNRWPIY
jgi:hypothetical protein